MQTKKFICCRVNSLRKTAGTLAEKVRIKTGDSISNLACGTGEVPYTKVDGKVVSYPFCVEGRGLIVNKKAIEDTLGKEFLNWMVYNETAQKLLFYRAGCMGVPE